MRLLILSLCVLWGCSPTCKDACEKIYAETLCAKETSHSSEVLIPGCIHRCRDHKNVGFEMDTDGPAEDFSQAYDWVNCVMEAECDELTTHYQSGSEYYDHCEMVW